MKKPKKPTKKPKGLSDKELIEKYEVRKKVPFNMALKRMGRMPLQSLQER